MRRAIIEYLLLSVSQWTNATLDFIDTLRLRKTIDSERPLTTSARIDHNDLLIITIYASYACWVWRHGSAHVIYQLPCAPRDTALLYHIWYHRVPVHRRDTALISTTPPSRATTRHKTFTSAEMHAICHIDTEHVTDHNTVHETHDTVTHNRT